MSYSSSNPSRINGTLRTTCIFALEPMTVTPTFSASTKLARSGHWSRSGLKPAPDNSILISTRPPTFTEREGNSFTVAAVYDRRYLEFGHFAMCAKDSTPRSGGALHTLDTVGLASKCQLSGG